MVESNSSSHIFPQQGRKSSHGRSRGDGNGKKKKPHAAEEVGSRLTRSVGRVKHLLSSFSLGRRLTSPADDEQRQTDGNLPCSGTVLSLPTTNGEENKGREARVSVGSSFLSRGQPPQPRKASGACARRKKPHRARLGLRSLASPTAGEHKESRGRNIHSANLKHLVLLYKAAAVRAIDVRVPKLDSLVVKVVNEMHIEAPKAQTASFFLAFISQKDPSVALMNLFRAPFPRGFACLMLNSNKTANGLAGIDEFIPPEYREEGMIFNLDFNLKDQSSTTILIQLLKKCNFCNTKFDIRVDSTRMQSNSTATARDDDNEHLTRVELINLQMMMPEMRFERFLSNQKKMKKFKHTGLEMLRKRTSREQFLDTLASEESLFQVSSSIANCIEMKI
ncbi:uncharacterized protein LOC141823845 [Curcuma longa]|uniref:uncharacterized protein LOC141823845 n=1 Tax=Curcuma longa TaxID=136217 RepID=UPI003D9E8EAD